VFVVFEKLKKWRTGFPEILSGKRKLAAIILVALAITAAIVGVLLQSSQSYTALFGSQQNIPISQVIEVLDGEKIDYRINPTDGQLLVEQSALSHVRMILAAKGITAILPAGYELMDKDELLGSSQFVQNVRYKRSLEGELAQTIMTLEAVKSARIHLAINESSSFVLSDQPQNSASVMLSLNPSAQLTDEQVSAIVHLVSGSVPGLQPTQVSVVDQTGHLLSDNLVSEATGTRSTALLNTMQDQISKSISNVLSPLVGAKNYRVSVMPELDMSAVEETRENYGDVPKIVNEHVTNESSHDGLAMGIPGSLSNRPPLPPAKSGAEIANSAVSAGKEPDSSRSENTRSYSYDRITSHIIHPSYQIKRMKVAVVLNKDGVKSWKDEQLNQLGEMLKNAAGIDTQRGDVLSLSILAFVPQVAVDLPAALSWWQDPSVLDWARLLGVGLLALLFMLLIINPLMKRFIARLPLTQSMKGEAGSALAMSGKVDAESLESEDRKSIEFPSFPGEDNLPALSSGLETKIEFLQKLAISDTDRVAEVFKQWISSNERNQSRR
jgi:flagellar M-ring protein FliF